MTTKNTFAIRYLFLNKLLKTVFFVVFCFRSLFFVVQIR